MKKFLAIILCVVLCVTAFAGCGSTGSDTKSADSSSPAAEASERGVDGAADLNIHEPP